MSSVSVTEHGPAEFTPEERALLLRLRLWCNLRWLVILGIIVATLVAAEAADIVFPTTPVYITCAIIAAYNLVFLRQARSLEAEEAGAVVRRAEINGNAQILVDLVTMTALLHFTGGIENPFVYFYLVHTTAAAVVLPKKRAYELATLALVMCALLFFLEYYEAIPHVNLQGFVMPYRYLQLSRVVGALVALAALVYSSTYVVTAVSGELRRRQREVVRLRDQLLEKRTRELEQITAEVAKLEEERRRFVRFLGVVAHDLRSPLVAVQGFMSYMLEGFTGAITDVQRDLLERGGRRIDGLLALIDDLLDIPLIESGHVAREMGEVSLNEVIRSAVDGLDAVAKQKGITLEVDLPDTLPVVRGSGRRLQQVVTNLVSNAISYTDEGSVLVRGIDSGDEVRVEVLDNGIGVPPQDLPRVLDDFFRGSNVQTKGTGLGLSICRRIVEAHQGRIWVESPCPETGRGSKFSFALPKRQVTASEAPGADAARRDRTEQVTEEVSRHETETEDPAR